MKAIEHTPTPWKSESGYIFSAEDQRLLIAQTNPSNRTDKNGNVVPRDMANAAYIVRAVNAHEELVEALLWLYPLAEAYLRNAPTHPDNAKLSSAKDIIAKVQDCICKGMGLPHKHDHKEAIAKAEGL